VTVVGVGVAGLSAANRISRAGLHVEVFEASDGVGERARTDRVDGFLLDRGFQMVSTAYPAARRVLDLEALDLRRFDRATLLHVERRRFRVGDPRREPLAVPLILAAPLVVCGTRPPWRRTPRGRPSDLCDASGHSTTCRSPGTGPAKVCPDPW
jgi:choline dehydrogenase-like flavoprotein